VPLLGDIPYLGNLFKSTTRSSNKTELLVFITPKIVTDRAPIR
jgi:type IV pilus assembly protein PilQ